MNPVPLFLRRPHATVAALTFLAALLSIWGLASQHPTSDDVNVAVSARTFVESGVPGPTMWYHPPLRSVLVFASLQLFGPGVSGVKGVSVLLGVASVPLLWLVARRLLGSDSAALIATFLWTIDALRVGFSRQAINDVYLAYFPLAALACLLPAFRRWRPGAVLAGGILFGLGIASKWAVLVPLGLALGGFLVHALRDTEAAVPLRRARAAFAVFSLTLVPLAVYTATFAPWFRRGYSLAEFGALQGAMSDEMRHHQGYLPYLDGDTKPWKWFVAPTAYRDFVFTGGFDFTAAPPPGEEWRHVTMFLVLPNPIVWWLVLPAGAAAVWGGLKRRRPGLFFAGLLFFGSYLPLAFAGRPIWLNTALSVLPWALICVGWFAAELFPADRRHGRALRAFLLAAFLVAIPQYLLVLGKGLEVPALRPALERYYPGAWIGR